MVNPLILIVDDEAPLRIILHEMLTKSDYRNVCEAESGQQALDMVAKHHPDLVFMDINLPDMDGIAAAKTILAAAANAKIIIMTGEGTPTRVTDSIKAGATNVIFKPFQVAQIQSIVQKALG